MLHQRVAAVWATIIFLSCNASLAEDVPRRPADGQPLAANVHRLLQALDSLGAPLEATQRDALRKAITAEDGPELQTLLDPVSLFVIEINPELRVKVKRGPGDPVLQQGGYTPVIVKVINDATLARTLNISSPQAGPVYAGASEGILLRQAQTELKRNENTNREKRFLDVEMLNQSPMTAKLSGLNVEYAVALIHSSEAGAREATLAFDVGEGTQDLGFRSEIPVLFSVKPAIPVKLSIRDANNQPTTARLEFRDEYGHVYPPQAKRLAPDFFFQPQIYRKDGDVVLLPPGEFTLESSRGPEYVRQIRKVTIEDSGERSGVSPPEQTTLEVALQRWIDPAESGFFSGDHHIHAAGCSHYDNPTQGVTPSDMFSQVKGEGLNVGCVLTWGPCFDHQRHFFSAGADTISEPLTVLKYDLEISGFGSAALGHVCLLNLQNQTYPGSEGTSTQGWPTWTVPVMRWAKEQGGVTGYPHSALHVDAKQAAARLIQNLDSNKDGVLSQEETRGHLLPEKFAAIESDRDGLLSEAELQRSADRAADELPNYAFPAMDGGGAMEIFVSTSEGVCDFISAMDTARIPEWNTWYHLLNCGYPLKLSGETDFPCMSSRRVGQGRVYVQLGNVQEVNFVDWCAGIAAGRSYVSDGYAHATAFTVNDTAAGTEDVALAAPDSVVITTTVAFAAEQPRAVAYGTLLPPTGKRTVGDTVNLHAPRDTGFVEGGDRLIEIIVNGQVAASQNVPADGEPHDLKFEIPIQRSSWIAVRQFPQLHTNPVNVIVDGEPIRASRGSALWCAESVRLLWKNRNRFIAEPERTAAKEAYERSLKQFLERASEATDNEELLVQEHGLDSSR
ncbi:MAG: CehA/McbA family metallohydrolase [Planctomycetota bacterium]|nr:CehA/McbA family metallohydrolase [Planctomycetota bacterium]